MLYTRIQFAWAIVLSLVVVTALLWPRHVVAQTPFHIVLLLDASASMVAVIDDVRNAAISALDAAPTNAFFAVVQFNKRDNLLSLQDFTDDLPLVKNAISRVGDLQVGTCLYDAVYSAVDLLDRQVKNPQERRAILLFTDGVDQAQPNNLQLCSVHSYAEMVAHAAPSNERTVTPIYPVGLYNAERNNINENELRELAKVTGAKATFGSATELVALFQQVMQLLSKANLQPIFPSVEVSKPICDEKNQLCEAALNIGGSEAISRFEVTLLDANNQRVPDLKTGVLVRVYNNNPAQPIVSLPVLLYADYSAGEYTIEVKVFGLDGYEISKPADAGGNQKEPLVTPLKFKYAPAPPAPLTVGIIIAMADWENDKVIITLNIAGDTGDLIDYDGRLYSNNLNKPFGPTTAKAITGDETARVVQIDLPAEIRAATEAKKYSLYICLNYDDVNGERKRACSNQATDGNAETSYNFEPGVAPQCAWSECISNALQENPLILVMIVIIPVFAFWLVQRKQPTLETIPGPYTPERQPVVVEPKRLLSTAQRRLQIKIVRTPQAQAQMKAVLTRFPCTIGRGKGCDFIISGDSKISREHAKITMQNGGFWLSDLASDNQTFLDDRPLAPYTPTQLNGSTVVRLGEQTLLELEPQD